jgi:fluoroacetyl-CoA thioesterase
MKNPFAAGDIKTFSRIVTQEDAARFESGEVHRVYATFALARDAEWSGRLFVLAMKEADEEGIGTSISVTHHSPALMGQEVIFTATFVALERNEVITTYEARVGARLIASGETRQKILKKDRLQQLFTSFA